MSKQRSRLERKLIAIAAGTLLAIAFAPVLAFATSANTPEQTTPVTPLVASTQALPSAEMQATSEDVKIEPHDPYKHAKDSYIRQAWGPNTVLIHCDWEYQFPASFASKQICQFHEWPLIVMSRPDDYYDGKPKEAYFNWMTMRDYPFGKQYEGFPYDFAEWDGTFTYTGINGTVEYGPTNEAPIGEGTYYVYAKVRIPSAVTVLSDGTFILGKTFTIEPSAYDVMFDANVPNSASTNVSGKMVKQHFNSRTDYKQLYPNNYSLPGYTFDSWNTKEDGSGDRYVNQAFVKDLSYAGKDVTLYARWKPKTYSITYNPGDASIGASVTDENKAVFDTPGTLKPVSEMGWTYENHRFLGWKVEGSPLLLDDEEDFVNLCGKITAYGDNPDDVELTAQWVENGQIVAVVTKDGEPQAGLDGGFSLKSSDGTIFTMPVTYEDDRYVFDPSKAESHGRVPSALPSGEYDLYFKIKRIPDSPGIPGSPGYPETSAHITYGGTSAASVVFDYYTVSIVEDGSSGVRDIMANTKSGATLDAFPGELRARALDGAKIQLQTNVRRGYHFDGYSAVGVAPSWDEDDPMKATQEITVHGQATIMAHGAANTYAVRFDANTKAAVMGEMEDQDMVYGEPQNLFANQFIRADATFTGWNTEADGSGVAYPDGQSVENLTEEDGKVVTLYAQWKTKVFTISFVDEDGTELQSDVLEYGVLPEYKGKTPSKAADAQYTYEFVGWSPEITIATGDETYTATYEALCTITFVDWDGTTLQSGKVAKGTTPKYEGAEPVRPADDENTYIFAGWSPEIVPVAGDATYTATYDATPIPPTPVEEYTITFVNWDGATLQSGKVAKGETPAYEGTEPVRPADKENTYKFAGWTPEIVPAAADATYTATYEATPIPPGPVPPTPTEKGTLTFDLAGGTLDGKTGTITIEANVGDVIDIPAAPTRDGYTFQYWKGSAYHPGDKYTVEGDHDFTAVWEENATPDEPVIPKTGDGMGALVLALVACALASLGLLAEFVLRRRNG